MEAVDIAQGQEEKKSKFVINNRKKTKLYIF